jgi:hypothetical protein
MKMNIPSIKRFGTTGLFVLALTIFTASFAQGQLNQCSNGSTAPLLPCTGAQWVNGNIGNDSQYREGDSVSFRRIGRNLDPGSTIVLTIEYDTTKAGKHAYDYLTTYNQTNTVGNDPCDAVFIGCDVNNPDDVADIPIDPRVTAGPDGILLTPDDIVQIPGEFTIWGGTITSVAPTYGLSGTYAGDSTTTLVVTILVGDANSPGDDTNVVLAWGGHIASRFNWGFGGSAALIPGSPYHMSTDLDPDRSLSVADVIFPAVIQIRKSVTTFGGAIVSTQSFPFTSPSTYLNSGTDAPITSFSLVDDLAVPDPNWVTGTIQKGKTLTFGTVLTFTEGQVFGWGSSGVTCAQFDAGFGASVAGVVIATGIGSQGPPFVGPFANITAQEGAGIRCTFSNLQGAPTAADVSAEGRVTTSKGAGIAGITVKLTNATTGAVTTTTSDASGNFIFEGLEVGNFYVVTGATKGYSYTQQQFVPNDNVTGLTIIASTATKGGR